VTTPVEPLPETFAELQAALAPYPDSVEICWVQEEPENMGAWTFVRPRIRQVTGREPTYVGRPERASPAEGYAGKHALNQRAIVEEALGISD